MKPKEMKIQKTFEKDYDNIMKNFQKEDAHFNNTTRWLNPGDYIVKFSLYSESTDSVVSTNTSPIL
jgi:hypothetical protein